MLTLTRLIAWLRGIARHTSPLLEPDRFSLRDWADLPPHHGKCDC